VPNTFTTLLKLVKAEIGGEENTWGDDIHDVEDALDAVYRDQGGDQVTGGAADAYTITPAHTDVSALADGIHGLVRIHAANTTASTLAWNGLAAKDWKKKVNGTATALVKGDLLAGRYARYYYSEADVAWILENPGITDILELHDWTDVASAATVDLGAVASTFVNITGAVTIASFGTARAGVMRIVKFATAVSLTYNATSMIFPNARDITTTAGSCAIFKSEGSGNWRLLFGFDAATSGTLATAAEIWAGTSTKAIGVDQMQAALAEVLLTDGATVTVDFAAGINFKLFTIGGNRTLAIATIPAAIVGRSGIIRIKQDGTGSRTLDMSSATIANINGQNLVLSTDANTEDWIFYTIISTSKVMMTMARAIA
jgi:hypothetical protein